MKKILSVVLAFMLVMSSTVGGFAGVTNIPAVTKQTVVVKKPVVVAKPVVNVVAPKIKNVTDLTAQYRAGELDKKEPALVMPTKLTSDQLEITNNNGTYVFNFKDLKFKNASMESANIAEYSDKFLKIAFDKSTINSKKGWSLTNRTITGWENSTNRVMVVSLTDESDKVIYYYVCVNDSGKTVEYTKETDKIKYDISNVKEFSDEYVTFELDEPLDVFGEYAKNNELWVHIKLNMEKLSTDFTDLSKVCTYMYNKIPLNEYDRGININISLSSASISESWGIKYPSKSSAGMVGGGIKENHIVSVFVGNSNEILGYSDCIYKNGKFEHTSVKELISVNPLDDIKLARTNYTSFDAKAVQLTENKYKKPIMKIDRTKLPKEMQKFTKTCLNSTSAEDTYGIDKSFTNLGMGKTAKYIYTDSTGLFTIPDGKKIYCLQLFDDSNKLLGYVVFK